MKHAAGEREAELPSAAKASGNRTGCGVQPTTMQKICSEGRQLSQMDKNLEVVRKSQTKIDKREASRECPPDPAYGGFVHSISYCPLIVHMRIEDQIRLWHHRCGMIYHI